ncbi:hypothetical protein ACFLYJ_00315 [Candidatus Cloacimonadota bacterium]
MKKCYLVIALVTIILLQGCNMIQLESMWKDREITIDGNDKDWIDAKYYLKDFNVVLGIMNDNDYLYICFYPTTQDLTKQLITQGCILWFNTDGKKKKEVGIHFPLGMQNPDMFEKKDKSSQRNPSLKDRNMEIPNLENILLTLPKELEIIGPAKNDVNRIKLKDLVGLEMAINAHKGLFAYELKIPLKDNPENSISLGLDSNTEFLIGLETAKIERTKNSVKLGGPTSGMTGGGRRNISGSIENSKMNQTPKSLSAWMKVYLATE